MAVEAWYPLAVVGGDANPRAVPVEFRPVSDRRARVPDRNLGSVARIPLSQARRNSRRTRWGLNPNRRTSGSSRMGTEWELGPLTIEQTTEDVHVNPPLGREQASEGNGCRATGDRFGQRAEIRDMAGATVCDVSRTSDRTAPNPGTSGGGALGASGRRCERSDGERTGPKRRQGPRTSAHGVPAGWPRRARPAT